MGLVQSVGSEEEKEGEVEMERPSVRFSRLCC